MTHPKRARAALALALGCLAAGAVLATVAIRAEGRGRVPGDADALVCALQGATVEADLAVCYRVQALQARVIGLCLDDYEALLAARTVVCYH